MEPDFGATVILLGTAFGMMFMAVHAHQCFRPRFGRAGHIGRHDRHGAVPHEALDGVSGP